MVQPPILFENDLVGRDRAFGFLRSGLSFIPVCWPDSYGNCACPSQHNQPDDIGKAPAITGGWAEYQKRQPTEEEIWSWFGRFGYQCNWGIIGGEVSGVVVLDFDSWESLDWFEQTIAPLRGQTLIVISGSGRGVHAYMRWRPGIKSQDLRRGTKKVCEVRGGGNRGRYVVAPGSRHRCGDEYAPPSDYDGRFGDVLAGEILVDRLPVVPDHPLLNGQHDEIPTTTSDPTASEAQPTATIPTNKWMPTDAQLILEHPEVAAELAKKRGHDGSMSGLREDLVGALYRVGFTRNEITQVLRENKQLWTGKAFATITKDIVRVCDKYDEKHPPEEDIDESALRLLMWKASDVEEKATTFLWKPFLPRHTVASFYGNPSEGKTFVALDICARITRGGEWPDGQGHFEAANCVYLSAEDDKSRTLKPRAAAAGANLERLYFITGVDVPGKGTQTINLKQHLGVLREMIRETDARLVVFDPIQSFLGSNVDMFRANETRPVIAPLIQLCEELDCTILFLGHENKNYAASAMHRALGSVDLVASMRSVFMAGHLQNDPEIHGIAHIKSSLARAAKPLAYRLESVIRKIEGIDVEMACVMWDTKTAFATQDLLEGHGDNTSKAQHAAEIYLKAALSDGARGASDLFADAEANGINKRALYAAADALGVSKARTGGSHGQWVWTLPSEASEEKESVS